MIISRTPYRISFFGGGTDYPAWYRQEGGAVLSTTIDKYCYITCRYLPPFFTVRHRVVWSHIETVGSISEILHPAVREGLRFLGFDDQTGIEIHHQGDLPARAGIASSSAFAVGLIKAMTALRGRMISKGELARTAIRFEQDVLCENVGSQDQVAAAFGGLNLISFERDGEFRVDPVPLRADRLEELQGSLLLIYTGTGRLASEVAATVVANFDQKRSELLAMRRMVDQGVEILNGDRNLDDFGRLLHAGWLLKRELSPAVTNAGVDGIYEAAMDAGALGGKLLGAGSAGFMVFYVPRERQDRVRKALANYLFVPFEFERTGSSIVYYDGAASAP